jgi:hypothetical protein
MSNIKEALEEFGEAYIIELTKQLVAADKKVTGNLINSLDYKVIETVNGIMLRISADAYLDVVDKGRRPGKFPPVKSIERWVKTRGIKFKKSTDAQTAFVIARSIKDKGIKPTKVLDKTKQNILQSKSKLLAKAVGLDINKLIDDIVKNINK